jgi:T5orf172 domain
LTTLGSPDPQDSVSPAAVYLLQRHDGQRFKIGWAVEPMARVKRLPEFMADELDLRASHAAWLPSPTRARQIERSLHRGLATQRAEPPHQLEGHTEWFAPAALRTAMRMLRQMPAGGVSSLPAALVPFEAARQPLLDTAPPDADSAVIVSAQDVLWAMEDLLLRACALNPVRVEGQGEDRVIRLTDVRGPRARLGDSMCWALLDLDTYRWAVGSRSGSFVQLMQYEGGDLLLQVTPNRTVRRWADGALTWQVQALLERLRGLAAYNRSAVSLALEAGSPL